jgi:hypothetical protein
MGMFARLRQKMGKGISTAVGEIKDAVKSKVGITKTAYKPESNERGEKKTSTETKQSITLDSFREEEDRREKERLESARKKKAQETRAAISLWIKEDVVVKAFVCVQLFETNNAGLNKREFPCFYILPSSPYAQFPCFCIPRIQKAIRLQAWYRGRSAILCAAGKAQQAAIRKLAKEKVIIVFTSNCIETALKSSSERICNAIRGLSLQLGAQIEKHGNEYCHSTLLHPNTKPPFYRSKTYSSFRTHISFL